MCVCVFGEVSAFAVLKLKLDKTTTTVKREKSRIKPFDESIFYCSRAESLKLWQCRWVFHFSWLEEMVFYSSFLFSLLLCPLSEHLFGISIRTLNF